jgi:aldehyde dehydrogenase (NAD+)
LDEAVALVNDSPYGLTPAIDTASVHRAMAFAGSVQGRPRRRQRRHARQRAAHGFGGVKQLGTGWREAGVEALDVGSDRKHVNLIHDPAKA